MNAIRRWIGLACLLIPTRGLAECQVQHGSWVLAKEVSSDSSSAYLKVSALHTPIKVLDSSGGQVQTTSPFVYPGHFLVLTPANGLPVCLFVPNKANRQAAMSIDSYEDAASAAKLVQLARRWQQGEEKPVLADAYTRLSESFAHGDEMIWLLAVQSNFLAAQYSQLFSLIETGKGNLHSGVAQHHAYLLAARAALYDRSFNKASYYLSLAESIESLQVDPLAVFERLIVTASVLLSSDQLDKGEAQLDMAEALRQSEFSNVSLPAHLMAEFLDNKGHAQLVRYYRTGSLTDLEQGVSYERRALKLALQAGQPRQIISINSNNAWLLRASNKFNSAIIHFLQALVVLKEQPDPIYQLYLYRNLGELFLQLGATSQARVFIDAALAQAEKNSLYWQAKLHCLLAEAHISDGSRTSAIREANLCFQQANFVAESAEDKRQQLLSQALALLVSLQRAAPEQVSQLAELASHTESPDTQTRAYIALASYQFSQGHLEQAISLFDAAIESAERGATPTLWLQAVTEAARASAIYQQDVYALKATQLIEGVAGELNMAELGPAWQQQVMQFYSARLEWLLSQQEDSAAFELLQQARTMSFRFKGPAKSQNSWPAAMDELEKNYFFNGDSYDLSLATARLLAELRRLRGDYSSDEDTGMTQAMLSLDQLKARLQADEGVLYFFCTSESYGAFWIRSNDHQVIMLGSKVSVEKMAQQLYEQLRSPMADPGPQVASVSGRLLSGVEGLTEIRRLQVFPEGALHQVPFAALTLDKGEPLITRMQLSQPISLSERADGASDPGAGIPLKVALFASPAFDEGFAQQLPRLPWSDKEANSIVNEIGADNALVYVGQGASKPNLLSLQVRESPILHISTHNHFDPERPLLGGFSLARTAAHNKTVADFVSFNELFAYHFSNQLVFLNGCSTAMGQLKMGDGLQSIARGFLGSGANEVIGTLWPLADRPSAEFSVVFYRQLKQSGDVGLALRQTQASFALSGRYKHPFYWAGYSLFTYTR